jgi:hypothetical protein
MQTLRDRLADWWEERKAIIDDDVQERVLPPADRMLDRFNAWCISTQQQIREGTWLRGRNRTQ